MAKQRVGRQFTRSDTVRSLLMVSLALLQPLATQLAQLTQRGVPETKTARATAGPVTPPDGAFIIWAVLFILSIVHAVGLSRRRWRGDAVSRQAGALAAVGFAGNVAWSLNAQYRGLGWTSVALIASSAISTILALSVSARDSTGSAAAHFSAQFIGPLAGWLSVATFANVETTLNAKRGPVAPADENRRAIVLIATAAAASSAVAVASRGNVPYALAVTWGLGGILLKGLRTANRSTVTAAAVGIVALTGATIRSRSRFGNPLKSL